MDSSYNYEKGKELSKHLRKHVDKYRKNLYKNRKKKLKRNISKEENDNYQNLSELQESNDGCRNHPRKNSVKINYVRSIARIHKKLDDEHSFLKIFLDHYRAGQKQSEQYISIREQLIADLTKFKQDLDDLSGDESYDKNELLDSKDLNSAMSAIIRVSRHIERKKALRERAAKIFKNNEFLLERANEELDKNKNKRNTKTFENAIIDSKNDILKADDITKKTLHLSEELLRYNPLSDAKQTLNEIEEREKKYRADIPVDFSKNENNPFLLEIVSHNQIKKFLAILDDYTPATPSDLPMEKDVDFLNKIIDNYKKFLKDFQEKKKQYEFFIKTLPEIMKLEEAYPSLFDDSSGTKEKYYPYNHEISLIGTYASGTLYLDEYNNHRYGFVYPSKSYKLYRNRGGNKLLIKVFGNKEAFEEYNRGVEKLNSLYQQIIPVLQKLGLPYEKPITKSLYNYFTKKKE